MAILVPDATRDLADALLRSVSASHVHTVCPVKAQLLSKVMFIFPPAGMAVVVVNLIEIGVLTELGPRRATLVGSTDCGLNALVVLARL